MLRIRRENSGFTLIELVVTVAIIGLLSSAAFPLLEMSVQRSKEQDLRNALVTIRNGIDEYKRLADLGHVEMEISESGYPPELNVLSTGIKDLRDPDLKKIYILRRIPRDPFYPDKSISPEDTWGMRSYESPPEAPVAGEDVFDVYSLSQRSGLNGVPYREW